MRFLVVLAINKKSSQQDGSLGFGIKSLKTHLSKYEPDKQLWKNCKNKTYDSRTAWHIEPYFYPVLCHKIQRLLGLRSVKPRAGSGTFETYVSTTMGTFAPVDLTNWNCYTTRCSNSHRRLCHFVLVFVFFPRFVHVSSGKTVESSSFMVHVCLTCLDDNPSWPKTTQTSLVSSYVCWFSRTSFLLVILWETS